MRYVFICAVVLAARPLAAQQSVPPPTAAPAPASVSRAAESITAEEIAQHVGALAADSTRGRGTPSPGLDRTAQYVLGQFAKLGLATSLQQYPLPGSRKMNLAGSRLSFIAPARHGDKAIFDETGSEMMKSVAVTFAGAARPGVGAVPEGEGSGWEVGWLLGGAERKPTRMALVSGRHTAASIARAGLRQDAVLYVPPAGIDSADQRQVVEQLRKSASVVILSSDDSATFAHRHQDIVTQPPIVVDGYIAGAMGVQRWAAYVRADALAHFWRLAGVDLAQARADTAPTIRQVAALTATLEVQPENAESSGPSGVNVVGVLPGTDPQLGNDYVVFSAHMDNGRGGQDDNAAGVGGLIALAKAFSQPGARPRRSLVFLATSGAANGSPGFGANFFAESPVVAPLALNVTLDDIGIGARDSILIDGLDDADFATRPNWIAANHPELRLVPVNGGTISDPALEHFAFVRRAIPTLSFHGRARDAGPSAASSPAAGDIDKAANVVRLVYYVGQELASAARRPTWSTVGRQHRLVALEW